MGSKKGYTESHGWCAWCGAELPPYKEWKYVLCPKCEQSANKNPIEHLSPGSSMRRKTSGMVRVKSYIRRASKGRRR